MRSILPTLIFFILPSIETKNITIQGHLLCNETNVENSRVRLIIHDFPDRVLNETKSTRYGAFEVSSKYEYSAYLKIEHNCSQAKYITNPLLTRVNDGCTITRKMSIKRMRQMVKVSEDAELINLQYIHLEKPDLGESMCMSDQPVQQTEVMSLLDGVEVDDPFLL